MRRIIASVSTTLDGFMEGPNGEGDLGWLMPFVPDGLADNARPLGEETDAILLGRGTYHGFAGFWPTQEGDFADLMTCRRSTSSRRRGRSPRRRGAPTGMPT